MVIHGNRLEDLRELLIEFIKAHPLGVLEPEIMLVQSNGMKQWLEQGLACDPSLGICAATRMELPSAYLWQAYRQVLGAQKVPRRMPFDKATLIWRLYRLLPELAHRKPAYAALRRYMGEPLDARKLYQLAFQVADVFDGYQSYRADWLADWELGRDQVRSQPKSDEARSQKLADLHQWQAQLWRDLLADMGPMHTGASRARVHQAFVSALSDRSLGAALPKRIIVFGISSLSIQTVEALAAMGRHCQVMMFVLNPCKFYWGDVQGAPAWQQRSLARKKPALMSAELAQAGSASGLLAAWGKQGRDYLHQLSDFDQTHLYAQQLSRVDVFVDPVQSQSEPTQLAQLQSAILNLQSAPEQPLKRSHGDDSITLLSAYSAQRELEVLHDQLLAWFEADPDLQPRDVMVMVPDLAGFAPQVRAVFGRFTPGQARHIPFSVADLGASTTTVVQVVRTLLNLPGLRISLPDWITMFEVDAVRKRFGLSEADVARLSQWLSEAGVRWGLDGPHRVSWGMSPDTEGLEHNTWAFGLRRLLLGYAFGAQSAQTWQGVLPQPGIGSLDAPLVGSLLAWLDAVSQSTQSLRASHSPARWVQILGELVHRFLEPTDAQQERQIQTMLEALQDWQQDCAQAGLDDALPLEVVSAHWLASLEAGALSQPFLGAGVQFASLMPMRAVPFKVVCLLGMHDGAYPRPASQRDFDLMALTWRAGDRSRREDDRYLFLEAILSARQKLLISWQGRRAHDNAAQPPSVLVAQLMDMINQAWTPAREVVQHPLQPFSPVYFSADSALQTFDDDWEAVVEEGDTPSEIAASALPHTALAALGSAAAGESQNTDASQLIRLEDLHQLLRQPAEVFFRKTLGVVLDEVEALAEQDEAFELSGLGRFKAAQVLLQSAEPAQAIDALTRSGQLPLAGFGQVAAQGLRADLEAVLTRKNVWVPQAAQPLEPVAVFLSIAPWQLEGTIDGLLALPSQENTPSEYLQLQSVLDSVYIGASGERRVRIERLVRLWVRHVALCASGHQVRSVLLGLDEAVGFEALPENHALAMLRRWLQVFEQARVQPLPVACKTAWAYLHIALGNTGDAAEPDLDKAHALAEKVFAHDFGHVPERTRSAYLARAFVDYQDIAEDLPHWAAQIYGDLHAQLKPLTV